MTAQIENEFTAMGLPAHLVENLAELGVNAPKPIQVKTIPPMLEGRDVLGIAQTGSGKTFAFALPLLTKIIAMAAKRRPKSAAALILTPTRELAVQIEQAIRSAAQNMHLRLALVLGGVSRLKQIKQMAPGVDILIATPGRLMDHVREGNIDLSATQFFVLDEADRMLDMGFIRDVRLIAAKLARHRQTALFSATMPKEIAGLADSLLHNPLKVETAPQGTTVAAIHETIYAVPQRDKKLALAKLLAQTAFRSVIVFTRTKHGADTVARYLDKAGCSVEVIHGNKSQNARTRALDSFRQGKIRALIATDIAARGIDVPGITHVVNFEFPVEAESYVHRIGRTGRNGASGEAITLYDSGLEASRLRAVSRLIGKKLELQSLPDLPAPAFTPMPEAEADERPAHNRGPRRNGSGFGKKASAPRGGFKPRGFGAGKEGGKGKPNDRRPFGAEPKTEGGFNRDGESQGDGFRAEGRRSDRKPFADGNGSRRPRSEGNDGAGRPRRRPARNSALRAEF